MPRRVPTAKINTHHVGCIREKTRRVFCFARELQSRNREMVSVKKIEADRVRVYVQQSLSNCVCVRFNYVNTRARARDETMNMQSRFVRMAREAHQSFFIQACINVQRARADRGCFSIVKNFPKITFSYITR